MEYFVLALGLLTIVLFIGAAHLYYTRDDLLQPEHPRMIPSPLKAREAMWCVIVVAILCGTVSAVLLAVLLKM